MQWSWGESSEEVRTDSGCRATDQEGGSRTDLFHQSEGQQGSGEGVGGMEGGKGRSYLAQYEGCQEEEEDQDQTQTHKSVLSLLYLARIPN